MKASAGYIVFFSLTPLFIFLPAVSHSKLSFCSIASGYRQQCCHGSEEDDSHQEARSLYGNQDLISSIHLPHYRRPCSSPRTWKY